MSKILVIDDEDDIILFLTTLLKKAGHETISAHNGREGLEIARREKPDLVTLDLMMPKQSGTDFFRNLVKDEALSSIPIIVVSGLAGRHLAVKKPAFVFDKPINPKKFLDAVERALAGEVED